MRHCCADRGCPARRKCGCGRLRCARVIDAGKIAAVKNPSSSLLPVSAIAPDPIEPAATGSRWLLAAHYWSFRMGAFVVLNVLDDPAWLALIFC